MQGRGHRAPELKRIAFKKIATDLYELCGVEVPKTYVVKEPPSAEFPYGSYSFESVIEEGTQELGKMLEAPHPASLQPSPMSEHVLNLVGEEPLAALLAAAAFLDDRDVIGNELRNVVLVQRGERQHLIKIAPDKLELPLSYGLTYFDEIQFVPPPADSPYVEPQPPKYILKSFGEDIPELNLHIVDVFKALPENAKFSAIKRITEISNEDLHKVVVNQELISHGLIPKSTSERIFEALKERRDSLAELYKVYLGRTDSLSPREGSPYYSENNFIITRENFPEILGDEVAQRSAGPGLFKKLASEEEEVKPEEKPLSTRTEREEEEEEEEREEKGQESAYSRQDEPDEAADFFLIMKNNDLEKIPLGQLEQIYKRLDKYTDGTRSHSFLNRIIRNADLTRLKVALAKAFKITLQSIPNPTYAELRDLTDKVELYDNTLNTLASSKELPSSAILNNQSAGSLFKILLSERGRETFTQSQEDFANQMERVKPQVSNRKKFFKSGLKEIILSVPILTGKQYLPRNKKGMKGS